ncbi:unnamed protein product [Closterium sp. Yama58-4]|nr:unnamed protein product [Closterium sp. Yama58-4]
MQPPSLICFLPLRNPPNLSGGGAASASDGGSGGGALTFPVHLSILPFPPSIFHTLPRRRPPLQLVVQRLPVTVAVVGGPVTFLSAGHRGPQPIMFNQGLYGTTRERSLATWASCDGATFLQSLPDDVDLVVAELALSDQGEAKGQGPESFLQMYDTVLQQLLLRWGGGRSPQTPLQLRLRQGEKGKEGGLGGVKAVAGAAVMMVNFFSFCRGNRACREAEVCVAGQGYVLRGRGMCCGAEVCVAGQRYVLRGRGMCCGAEGYVLRGRGMCCGAEVCVAGQRYVLRGRGMCCGAEDPSLSFADVGPFSFGLPPHHPAYPHQAPETVSEDNITVLAQYYSLPVLSTRDAFFTLLGHQAPGYRLKEVVTTGHSNLPLHVEPDSLSSAIPPSASDPPPDTADDSYGTGGAAGAGSSPVDSIDPIDPHALSGALPTAVQARTKYADVITALFHSALTGKSAAFCSFHA